MLVTIYNTRWNTITVIKHLHERWLTKQRKWSLLLSSRSSDFLFSLVCRQNAAVVSDKDHESRFIVHFSLLTSLVYDTLLATSHSCLRGAVLEANVFFYGQRKISIPIIHLSIYDMDGLCSISWKAFSPLHC